MSTEATCSAIILGMRHWFEGLQCSDTDERSPEQRSWDKAILTAAEYIRRRMNYDETLAFEIHQLLCDHLPK